MPWNDRGDPRIRRGAVTAAVLLTAWAVVGLLVPTVLPGPVTVAGRLPELFGPGPGGEALVHLGVSFVRVGIASAIALVLAVCFGVLLATWPPATKGVGPWLPFWMTVPSLVVVLVTMVLFNFSTVSVIAAVVVVATPFAAVNVWEGAADVDGELVRMAAVHGAAPGLVLREIYLPAVLPAIFGSARFLLSMVWKVVVLAETFGLSTGMGALFRFWFNQGDLVALLAALAVFVAVMVGMQAALTRIEDRVFAWRP